MRKQWVRSSLNFVRYKNIFPTSFRYMFWIHNEEHYGVCIDCVTLFFENIFRFQNHENFNFRQTTYVITWLMNSPLILLMNFLTILINYIVLFIYTYMFVFFKILYYEKFSAKMYDTYNRLYIKCQLCYLEIFLN